MKVLFLDIDGVLNNRESMMRPGSIFKMNEVCVARLRRVIEETGAKVVLSSTWRLGDGWQRRLAGALIDAGWAGPFPLVGRTPDLARQATPGGLFHGVKRGSEIAAWLGEHPEVTRYAIVDDDNDMLPEQFSHFVRTSHEPGLTDKDAEALQWLLA